MSLLEVGRTAHNGDQQCIARGNKYGGVVVFLFYTLFSTGTSAGKSATKVTIFGADLLLCISLQILQTFLPAILLCERTYPYHTIVPTCYPSCS